LPTPAIGGVGLIQDLDKAIGNSFTQNGQVIYLLGETKGHLGSSLYQRDVLDNHEIVAPPRVDLALESAHGHLVRAAIDQGLLAAAHDVSDGGLLVALAEMCLTHGIGAEIDTDGDTGYWFGEDQARYVVSVAADKAEAFEALAGDVSLTRLGKTSGNTLTFGSSLSISVSELHDIYEGWFPALMSS
jgi:phosphoribosylformylglycinamidine (FGAM) synthase-like enzyme